MHPIDRNSGNIVCEATIRISVTFLNEAPREGIMVDAGHCPGNQGRYKRFVNVPRKIAGPPAKVWINPPAETQVVA